MTDRALTLRAAEIITTSAEPIHARDAVKQALLERYHDLDSLADAAAAIAATSLTALRKRSYEVPDDDGQQALFDIPSVIGVTTDSGDLFVPRADAATGHVRQWRAEGQSYHAVQLLKFQRAAEELGTIADVPDDAPWSAARTELANRKAALEAEVQAALESGA